MPEQMTRRFDRWRLKILTVAFLAIMPGCQKQETPYVATVNGDKILVDEYRERCLKQLGLSKGGTSLPATDKERLKEEVLNILMQERLMIQRARALSLTVTDSELDRKIEDIRKDYGDEGFKQNFSSDRVNFDRWKEELKHRLLMEKLVNNDVQGRIPVSGKDALAYYRNNIRSYTSPPRVHAAQIVVRDQEKAEKILERLNAGGDFGKVAREESIAPEAERGGDLGSFSRGVMPEEIDAVVFAMAAGKVSRVVKSPYGFHIFKVLKREPGGKKAFSAVREQVIEDIRRQKGDQAYVQWLQDLRSKAVIQINGQALKKLDVTP